MRNFVSFTHYLPAGLGNQQLTTVSAGNVFLENVDSVSNIFDDVVNTIETNSENVNSLLDRGNGNCHLFTMGCLESVFSTL